MRGDKRILPGLGILAVVAVGVIVYLGTVTRHLSAEGATDRLRALARRLTTQSGALTISVEVFLPQIDGNEAFEGQGVVDVDSEQAAITYDFSELVNPAGGFGQLQEFDVVMDGDTVYVDVFESGAGWISFLPEQSARRDVERLREMVLASPLILPEYLEAATSASGSIRGSTIRLEGIAARSALSRQRTSADALIALLERLDVHAITLGVEMTEGSLSFDYELAFPFAPGANDEIVVRVSTDFQSRSAPEIDVPPANDVRDLDDFFD